MDLYEKSLKTLELPAVLEMLSREAVSRPAKEKALSIRPGGEPAEVRRRLGETTAARSMMAAKGSPSFAGVKDVRSALARADMGGMLNPRELLDIAGVLQAARHARAYGEGDRSQTTEIDYLFRALRTNRFLEDKITGCITEEEEIADSASAELSGIRRQIRATNAKIREILQNIISSPSYSKLLQEPIITTRSERYVVPVKAEHKGEFPGLVHDVSASGATLFIEPMAVVKANNELRELKAKEKLEIERILMELSADCADYREEIESDFSLLVELDVIFAKARLGYKLKCSEPAISGTGLRLKQARHPLLDQETAVPIDVELGDGFDTLVITGPNTGGKTVSLKTIGLLSVMAQCGLHIPAAEGSCLPVFKAVLADIGDEQSIQQSLSTFSSHMTNIVSILKECGPGTMLLFDELGAGTDPVEGAALAIAIIEYARKRGSLIAATTHYAELKVYATSTPGVQNASCEFDIETLQPTYRLLLGIPGKSNAFAISERLGMPAEVIEDARGRVGVESASFEETIEKLEQARQLIERDRLEEEKKLRQTEENLKKSEEMRRELEAKLEKAGERARREAERILEEARREAEEVFAQLDEMRKRQAREEDYQRINEARAQLRRKLNEAEERLTARKRKPVQERRPSRPVRPGDTVEILPMGIKATVISVDPERGLELQAGIMRVTAKESEVALLEDETAKKPESYIKSGTSRLRTASVSPELDIRGMMTDEAIPVLEQYLDGAALANLSSVTIIHGKGTGALRQAVHESLKRNRLVKSFRLGRYGEGETGVTIVELK